MIDSVITYINQAPQQLPGLPQLLGFPQQPPGMLPLKLFPETEVLCAEISFERFVPLHDLQDNSAPLFPKIKNSLISPQSWHLYSKIGIFSSHCQCPHPF